MSFFSAKLFSEIPTMLSQPPLDPFLLPGKEIPDGEGNTHLSERSKSIWTNSTGNDET